MADVVKANENIFLTLGFPPHEAEVLQLRADLMGRLAIWIRENGLTSEQAAEYLGISQTRISDLIRGKWKKFSVDLLLTLAGKAGIRVRWELDKAA